MHKLLQDVLPKIKMYRYVLSELRIPEIFFFFPLPRSKFSKFIPKIAGNTETERKRFMGQLYLYFGLCHLEANI